MPRVPSMVLTVFATGLAAAMLSAQAPAPAAPAGQVDFARDIQPILDKSCSSCHSPSMKVSQLDLSSRDAAIKGGAHGTALVPGSAERSKLYRMVAGLDKPAMPMQGEALTSAQIAAIKSWIDQGANWETPVTFAKDIQPIMERTCWNCHGGLMQASKLDLRTRESALRGGAHGSAFVPGNAEGSRLYRLVAGLEAIRMPLEGGNLTDAEIAAVKAWINQGGQYPVPAEATPEATAAPTAAATKTTSRSAR